MEDTELSFDAKGLDEYTQEEKAKAFDYLHDLWYSHSNYGNLMQQMLAAHYIRIFFDGSH